MSTVPMMDAAALAMERYKEPLELANALIDSDLGLGDGLASKIREYLSDEMLMISNDKSILVNLTKTQLHTLQGHRSNLKKEIVQACLDGRISQCIGIALIRLMVLENA